MELSVRDPDAPPTTHARTPSPLPFFWTYFRPDWPKISPKKWKRRPLINAKIGRSGRLRVQIQTRRARAGAVLGYGFTPRPSALLLGGKGPLFGFNINYFSKYLRKKLTQNLTPQRPSSTKPGARFARANPVFAGPLWSQILSQCFA